MADNIRFDVSGLDGVKAKMAQLKNEANAKGGRAALRKATAVLRAQAQSNARRVDDYETGEAIWKNIDQRWDGRAFKRDGQLAFRLGVLGGAKQYGRTRENRRKRRTGQTYATNGSSSNPGGDTWYWRHVELGTAKVAARPSRLSSTARSIAHLPSRRREQRSDRPHLPGLHRQRGGVGSLRGQPHAGLPVRTGREAAGAALRGVADHRRGAGPVSPGPP